MSSISIGSDPVGSGVTRIGAELRAARERLGWDLPSVADVLRIRQPFLEAIEGGRIGDLPGNAYAVGFLRAYASALGLDPDETARRFKAEAADVNRKTKLIFPAPVPERGVPAGAVALIGLVVAIGAYAVWYRVSSAPLPHGPAVPPVPARLAARITPPALPPVATPAAPAPAAAAVGPTPAPAVAATTAPATPPLATPTLATPTLATSAPAAPAPTPAIVAAPAAAAGAAGIAAAAPSPASPAASAPTSAPPASASTSAPPTSASLASAPATTAAPLPAAAGAAPVAASPAAAPSGGLSLRATADSWIEVRDAQGRILFSGILHPGDSWAVPAGQAVTLTTGNAGGTELVVDGKVSPPLGASGQVRRNLTLDPSALAGDGFAALISPAAAATPAPASTPAASTSPAPVPAAPAPAVAPAGQ